MEKPMTPAEEREMAISIWLNFINHTLWEKKKISDTEYQRMCEKIATRRQTPVSESDKKGKRAKNALR